MRAIAQNIAWEGDPGDIKAFSVKTIQDLREAREALKQMISTREQRYKAYRAEQAKRFGTKTIQQGQRNQQQGQQGRRRQVPKEWTDLNALEKDEIQREFMETEIKRVQAYNGRGIIGGLLERHKRGNSPATIRNFIRSLA